jgi:hypothetical protein
MLLNVVQPYVLFGVPLFRLTIRTLLLSWNPKVEGFPKQARQMGSI